MYDLSKLSSYWATILIKQGDSVSEIGISNGLAGIALFFYLRYLENNDPSDEELVLKFFEKIVTRIENGNVSNSIVIEFTEVLLFMDITKDLLSKKYNTLILRNQLFGFVQKANIKLIQLKEYDPYTGCFFPAYYFQQSEINLQSQYVYLDLINKNTKYIDGDLNSSAYFDSNFEKGRICLSITHGLAFYIVYLTGFLYKRNEIRYSVESILMGYVKFLMQSRLSFEDYGCFFADYLDSKIKSRLCLCYGDLGIIYSLYKASKLLGDKELEYCVLQMLNTTFKRVNPIDTGVRDSSLLYGSGGIYYYYSIMNSIIDDINFNQSVKFWKEEANRHLDNEISYYYTNSEINFSTKQLSFAEGITGTISVLACSKIEYLNKLRNLFYLT
jgi:hypothetical protein